MDPKTYEQQQPLIAQIPQVPLLPQHIITSGTRKDCIRLRGLPYEAQVEHILDFLGEHAKSIVFQGVHMVYNAQGQPSGEAFIQMESEQSAYIAASQKHHRYMIFGKKQRYIEVFQCSGEDMNLVLTGGLPAPGAVSPAAKAATLLSPGMLPTHPPPIGPPPQLYETPFPLVQHVQAQQALAQQVQHNLALRQSQQDSLMFLNQIAAAQQHQAAVAAALNAAANSKQNWADMSTLADTPVVSSPPSTSASSHPITSSANTIAKQNGTQYGSLVHSAAGYPAHPPPPPTTTALTTAGIPPGMFFLNVPQRLPVTNSLLAQGPHGNAFHPRVPPPPITTHPPPPHGMLPHLVPTAAAAAAGLLGAKRSWDQAFPTELQQTGLKRPWQPSPSIYQSQNTLTHPAFTYQNTQLQFYPTI